MTAATVTQFSFAIEHMTARDEILVKSFIEIIRHNLTHQWVYVAGQADLRLYGDQGNTLDVDTLQIDASQAALILAHKPHLHLPTVRLPVNAHHLKQELNRLGDALLGARLDQALNAKLSLATQHIPSAALSMTATSSDSASNSQQNPELLLKTLFASNILLSDPNVLPLAFNAFSIKLKKWPSMALLNYPSKKKLSAALLGDHTRFAELQARSRVDMAECLNFTQELLKAGLLDVTLCAVNVAGLASQQTVTTTEVDSPNKRQPISVVASSASKSLSFIQRVRARLGLA